MFVKYNQLKIERTGKILVIEFHDFDDTVAISTILKGKVNEGAFYSMSVEQALNWLSDDEKNIFNTWLATQRLKKKIFEPLSKAYWKARWSNEKIFSKADSCIFKTYNMHANV